MRKAAIRAQAQQRYFDKYQFEGDTSSDEDTAKKPASYFNDDDYKEYRPNGCVGVRSGEEEKDGMGTTSSEEEEGDVENDASESEDDNINGDISKTTPVKKRLLLGSDFAKLAATPEFLNKLEGKF